MIIILNFQLHTKFDSLKRQHADDKKRLEDSKKALDQEMAEFQKRKTFTEQHSLSNSTLKHGKKK